MRTRIKEFRARYNLAQEDLANLVGTGMSLSPAFWARGGINTTVAKVM